MLSQTAGSHTCLVLLDHGAKVTIIDNMNNSFPRVFEVMTRLAGDKADQMKFIKVMPAAYCALNNGLWQQKSHQLSIQLATPETACLAGFWPTYTSIRGMGYFVPSVHVTPAV